MLLTSILPLTTKEKGNCSRVSLNRERDLRQLPALFSDPALAAMKSQNKRLNLKVAGIQKEKLAKRKVNMSSEDEELRP